MIQTGLYLSRNERTDPELDLLVRYQNLFTEGICQAGPDGSALYPAAMRGLHGYVSRSG